MGDERKRNLEPLASDNLITKSETEKSLQHKPNTPLIMGGEDTPSRIPPNISVYLTN